MLQGFVIDKVWVHDYIERLHVQRDVALKLMFSINKVKLKSQRSEWVRFDRAIRKVHHLAREMEVIADSLEQLLQGEEIAALKLRRDMEDIEERLRFLS